MSQITKRKDWFIPCTREIAIGDDVVYRPTRMWHSGTFAGERLTSVHGDGSGCCRLVRDAYGERATCDPPKSVVTRLYWNVKKPDDGVSAFLSYPNGLTILDEYAWEVLGTRSDGDIERWTGPDAEQQMEDAIRTSLGTSTRGTMAAREAAREREERPAKLQEAKQIIRDAAAALRGEETKTDDTDLFTLN
jgi:hypothetical protein